MIETIHIHNLKNAVNEIVDKNGYKTIVFGNKRPQIWLLLLILGGLCMLIIYSIKQWFYPEIILSGALISVIIIIVVYSKWRKKLENKVMHENNEQSVASISHKNSFNYLNKYWFSSANTKEEKIQIIDFMQDLCDKEKKNYKISIISKEYAIAILSPIFTVTLANIINTYSLVIAAGFCLIIICLALMAYTLYKSFDTLTNRDCEKFEALKRELEYLKIMLLHSQTNRAKHKNNIDKNKRPQLTKV